MDRKSIEKLIGKYLEGKCSPEERSLVEQWYNAQIDEKEHPFLSADIDEFGDKILNRLPVKKKNKKDTFYRSIAAALILAAASFAINSYVQNKNDNLLVVEKTTTVIAPGGNKAFLTLEDGSQVLLDDLQEGETLQQKGVSVSKAEDGQLVYSVKERVGKDLETVRYNTISTPRGGQYQVLLPDGTKVWLNAESSLRYPTSFASLDKREVELKGEAYFEVKHASDQPFLVQTKSVDSSLQQVVRVLGTRFNIHAYGDDGVLKTTLVEGSVNVRGSGSPVMLKPGQQSKVSSVDATQVNYVNVEAALAWKDGYFMFDNDRIEDIMQKIARWYNVDVEFRKVDKAQVFSGTISKFEDVKNVLNLLELTGGVHFEINEKKIIVN